MGRMFVQTWIQLDEHYPLLYMCESIMLQLPRILSQLLCSFVYISWSNCTPTYTDPSQFRSISVDPEPFILLRSRILSQWWTYFHGSLYNCDPSFTYPESIVILLTRILDQLCSLFLGSWANSVPLSTYPESIVLLLYTGPIVLLFSMDSGPTVHLYTTILSQLFSYFHGSFFYGFWVNYSPTHKDIHPIVKPRPRNLIGIICSTHTDPAPV